MKALFIGDIVGKRARSLAYEKIKMFKENNLVDLVIVNVENSAGGFGVTKEICESFFDSGADILTTGNHVWDKKEIIPFLNESKRVLRPLNMVEGSPGIGLTIVETVHGLVGVANLITNLFMMSSNPVFDYLAIIKKKISLNKNLVFSIVDIHGEATSEKLALGFSLDGYVSAVVGTHTHIPTADHRILDNGTAYITDVGMSGDYNSVIGMEKTTAIEKFTKLNKKTSRLEVSMGDPTLCGVLIETYKNGLAKSIKPVRIGGVLDNIDLD